MRANTQTTLATLIQRASLLLVWCALLATDAQAQRTTTVYATTPYTQSTNWWSSLFSNPSSSAASGISKIPAAGRAVSSTPHPAVARIIVPERKSAALGSGTLIAKTAQHGYLITNWHVVREASNGALVVFANGTQAQGRILKMDKDWDLAIVQIPAPAIEPLSISSVVPQVGEQLWIAGYGSGEFLLQAGLCSQYLAPYPDWPMELVEVGAAARQGDSGGPILNARGELAGVLFGQGDGYTMGAYGGRVLQFLGQVPDLDSPTRGTIAQLAVARPVITPTNIALASQSSVAPNPVAMTLVSNSRETQPDQRYWYPERRQPGQTPETKPEQRDESAAMLATTAAPAPVTSLALKPSEPASAAASLSMYSLPKTPTIAPPVASQYKPNLDQTQNIAAVAPGYGLSKPQPSATPFPSPNVPAVEQLSFEDLAGHSLADQAITGLWCLGSIYLLFKICGWLTRANSGTPKKAAKRIAIRKPAHKAVAARVQKNDLYSYDEDDDEDEDEDDEDDDDDE